MGAWMSRWVALALVAEAALAVADILTGSSLILTSAYLVPAVAVAVLDSPRRSALVGALAVALAVASGAWNDYLFSGEHLARLAIVAVTCGLAVAGSVARAAALATRDRMATMALENGRLLEEFGGARRRLEAVLASLGEAVTIRDETDRIVYANDAALRSMGFSSMREITERPPLAIMDDYIVSDEEGRPVTMDQIPSVRLLRGESSEPLTIRFVHRETGVERWSVLKANPVEDEPGATRSVVTVIEDVTAMKRAETQTRMLAEANDILASSLDYEHTLRNVAWLAVPSLADWCAVDLLDAQGGPRRVVVAHPDEARLALAERLRRYQSPDPRGEQGLAAVLRTGRSELYPEISAEMLEAAAVDEEHHALLHAVGMRSACVVPLRVHDRVLGAMTLVNAESGRRFDEEDVRFAEQIAARAAVAVENARLYTQRSEIAATLQKSLLPEELPSIDGWQIAALYRPAGRDGEVEVGGDFYDAFPTAGGWMVLIGDVTGKGVQAAAMSALVRHGARFVGPTVDDPAQLLTRLDATLRQESRLSLCSAICMSLEARGVTFASAGHPLPMVIGPDGVTAVGRTGPLLGAFREGSWPAQRIELGADEVLLLYTDGVTDTRGERERFGEERLRELVSRLGPRAAPDLLAGLDRALAEFQVGPQADDTAALALRRV